MIAGPNRFAGTGRAQPGDSASAILLGVRRDQGGDEERDCDPKQLMNSAHRRAGDSAKSKQCIDDVKARAFASDAAC